MCTNQIWKDDSQYVLVSQQRVGLSKGKTGEADDSDDIEEEVEDDETSTDSDGER